MIIRTVVESVEVLRVHETKGGITPYVGLFQASPHVPTALSTPEGLPWMIISPWKAQLLISSRSS